MIYLYDPLLVCLRLIGYKSGDGGIVDGGGGRDYASGPHHPVLRAQSVPRQLDHLAN